ncbi:phosphotransferase family protein [Nocardioides mesophilus]|uniref:Aminoglycoside phosphotransferase family protein n=1 Tax=Nocardioides mesophilus TaxID=433659 RepID=A0A7G9RDR5_9ACTN|nr:aminoglycoside phosphotransferase family protein [Nocardioides mesophilus]QNN53740.1 aminoglycoside phosphotransferase family protein [Nocardioides mesophilus]
MLTADGLDVTAALTWAGSSSSRVTGARELFGGWTSTMLALSTEAGDDLVLRLMTREPWRSHGSGLTTRESEIQEMLAPTAVPAPRSWRLDAHGCACGFPAHLMSLLPGRVELDRVDDRSLGLLADLLATIHAVSPTIEVRTYQSWAWEAKYVVPTWATDPGLWQEAFTLLRTPAPAYEPSFLHRDFQPRNVLWSEGRISGVVDWVETSIGPAWLDVAHCCTNLALRHGDERADSFAAAYVGHTGAEPQLYFEVMDIVGFLPPPGKEPFIKADDERARLEERLRAVMLRVG